MFVMKIVVSFNVIGSFLQKTKRVDNVKLRYALMFLVVSLRSVL